MFEFEIGHRTIRVKYRPNLEIVILELVKCLVILKKLVDFVVIFLLLGHVHGDLVEGNGFFEFLVFEVGVPLLLVLEHRIDNFPESFEFQKVFLAFVFPVGGFDQRGLVSLRQN